MEGSCKCGAVRIEASRPPATRFFCHCTTCQRVYDAPYADISVLWSHLVRVTEGADRLEYRRYRKVPVSVNRGVCLECDRPVIGRLTMPPIPPRGVTFVPAEVWGEVELPEPAGHVFYHRRVVDVDDGLPKREGFWSSELSATGWILSRLLHPGR